MSDMLDKIKKSKTNREDMSKKFIEYRNFAKISAYLADYGYVSHWNQVDDKGADFICSNVETCELLKIQLKGRVTVSPKYCKKDIYMAFPKNDKIPEKDWVIVPHDELFKIFNNRSKANAGRSSGKIPKDDWEEVRKEAIFGPFDLP